VSDWSQELRELDPLPDTLDEAVGIAHALGVSPDDTILAGRNATRRSVMAMSASGQLATKNIILFATHGLTPSDLGGRIQQPALAMSLDSADKALPLLTLEDVMELRMNAEWVLLSACNTASADSVDGDAISGLARGFIFAGAKSLLATHWSVESESSKALTQAVMSKYLSTPSLTRAQALQAASLSLIDGQNVAADWTHPVFWAPFSLVGNGQR
jgi:CHAT domain-containing protein